MDVNAMSVVGKMFERIDGSVPRQGVEQSIHARRLFSNLEKSGGSIEAIGEPFCYRTPIAQLGRWSEDPWEGATYGIDASTTRSFEYTNGIITDTAYAKLGVGGSDADRTPERSGTIKTVIYYDEGESTLHEETFESDGEGHIHGENVLYQASSDSTRNLSQSVTTVAQSLAEGEHARRCLDDIDSVLFLDGSLYPLGVLYWVLLDYADNTSPAASWDRPAEIIENYIEVIDTLYERNLPVIGVVKTSTTAQLVDALSKKLVRHNVRNDDGLRPDVSWTRDHQFIADVLRDGSLDDFTYTSWFVSTKHGAMRDDTELLDPFADTLKFGKPGDYRRAFFYVRLPKQEFVFRVEAPLLFVQDEEMRHEIQYKALKEIARRRDVPQPIKRADRIARISQSNRAAIRRMVEMAEPSMDYNRDGRWSQDDITDMEVEK